MHDDTLMNPELVIVWQLSPLCHVLLTCWHGNGIGFREIGIPAQMMSPF